MPVAVWEARERAIMGKLKLAFCCLCFAQRVVYHGLLIKLLLLLQQWQWHDRKWMNPHTRPLRHMMIVLSTILSFFILSYTPNLVKSVSEWVSLIRKTCSSKNWKSFWKLVESNSKYLHCPGRVARWCRRTFSSLDGEKRGVSFWKRFWHFPESIKWSLTGKQNSSKEGLTNLVYWLRTTSSGRWRSVTSRITDWAKVLVKSKQFRSLN